MDKHEKLLKKILDGKSDNNIKFIELCNMLEAYDISLDRIRGDHYIFVDDIMKRIVDIQPDKRDRSKAKAYQIKQIRKLFMDKEGRL